MPQKTREQLLEESLMERQKDKAKNLIYHIGGRELMRTRIIEAMLEFKNSTNWEEIREKFFNQCVDNSTSVNRGSIPEHQMKINMAPYDLFEWFKTQIRNS